MLKRTVCLFLALFLCFGLFGCGQKGVDAQVIYPIDKDPKYLDPQIVFDVGAKNIIANCFEGLVTIDGEGNIAPGCAEKWTVSPDGLTYTFKLRDDCKWRVSSYAEDVIGEEEAKNFDTRVTADDFVFAFRRALRPETKSPGAKSLYSIKNAAKVNSGKVKESKLGVKAKDDFTLEITLEWEDPDFLYTLLEPACMPCDERFFEITGGRYGLAIRYLLYNGPFYVSNWVDDSAITIRRNEEYYDKDSVIPLSVYFSINNEQETRLKKLKEGTYELTPLTGEQAKEIDGSKKYSAASFSSSVLSLVFNCKDGNLSNINIRRAIAASFDAKLLSDMLGDPTAKGVLPSSMILSGKSYRQQTGSLSLYKNADPQSLLNKGLQELEKSDIEVTVLCDEAEETTVRNLMQSWQVALGVKFNVFVEPVTSAQLQSRVKSGDYQLAFCPVSYSSVTAFNGVLRYTTEDANNILNFSDSAFDKTVNSIKTAGSGKAAVAAILKAEKHLISSCVIIPLYEQPVYYGIGEDVSGTVFNPTGEILYFKNTLVG